MPALVCYCFGYTEDDIRQDCQVHGRSTILEQINTEKQLGNCRCTEKSPKGR